MHGTCIKINWKIIFARPCKRSLFILLRRQRGEAEVQLYVYTISALDGDERSALRPGLFTPQEREPVPNLQEVWWTLGPGLEWMQKISPYANFRTADLPIGS